VAVELRRQSVLRIFLVLPVSGPSILVSVKGFNVLMRRNIDPLVDLGENVEGGIEGFLDFLGASSD